MQNVAAAVGTLLFLNLLLMNGSSAHGTKTSLRAHPMQLAQSCDLHTCRTDLETRLKDCRTSLRENNPPDPAQRDTYRKCVADGRQEFQQCVQVTCPGETLRPFGIDPNR